jgi:hypothetical protein
VMAAPNREIMADRRVSPWGKTVTVGNAMRTAAARSPAWTRGRKRRGACDAHVAVGGGERGGKRRERGMAASSS